ncbi:hypothetical protein LCGC14_1208170 [marine sediment metagenome]|uniref:Uncharacterized protein n=1 Tax=marine sediment metagenome TaxID=412755 RepID=A0A0F9M288_9ZZZZ
MNKRESIRECKRLWKEIKKSGLGKVDFLSSYENSNWVKKKYRSSCPLCEYQGVRQLYPLCPRCPLVKQYGTDCFGLGYSKYGSSPEFFKAIRGLKE